MQDSLGKTVLHYVSRLYPAISQLLLEHGAQPHIKDSNGMTALHKAMTEDNPETAKILLAYGGKSLAAIKNNENKRADELGNHHYDFSTVPYTVKGFMCDGKLHELLLDTGMECVINNIHDNDLCIIAYYAHGFKSYLLGMNYPGSSGSIPLNNFFKLLKALDGYVLSEQTDANTYDNLLRLENSIIGIQKNIANKLPHITYLNSPVNNIFDGIPPIISMLIYKCRDVAKVEMK